MRPEINGRVSSKVHPSTVERWQIDPTLSTLTFTLRHIVVSEIRGKFQRWGGRLVIDRDQPALSEVEIWVDLGSVDTDAADRDDQLRSEEFFDVGRFPRARFNSTSIVPSDERFQISGVLELRGVRHPIELDVTTETDSRSGDVSRARFDVRGTVDRQAFGLHWNQDLDVGGVVVGDKVHWQAHVEAFRVPEWAHLPATAGGGA